jgi:hypothetical protein
MQACVEVWESDPAAYAYNPVGYMAIGCARQESDLTSTYERQERIGYRSSLVTGERECDEYMKALFPDWRAQGVTVVLHEHQAASRSTSNPCSGSRASARRRACASSPESR